MAGRGPAPSLNRRRRSAPIRGDWALTTQTGWQLGTLPEPPDGLLEASRIAWDPWMRGWFASHWIPGDLPGLRLVVRIYDATERGAFKRSAELQMWMNTYGITPRGQQDRRWKPPEAVSQPRLARATLR